MKGCSDALDIIRFRAFARSGFSRGIICGVDIDCSVGADIASVLNDVWEQKPHAVFHSDGSRIRVVPGVAKLTSASNLGRLFEH
jgi:hypothetical protein